MIPPDDDDLRAPADRQMLRLLLQRLRPDAAYYIVALLAAPVSTLLSVVQPWLLKHAIDDYILKGDIPGVLRMASYYLVAILTAFVAETVYTLGISAGSLRTITRLRREVYEHTMELSASFFDKRPTGRLLTRATSDVESLGEVLTAGAVTIILDALLVLGIITAMVILDARLTLVTLVLAPLLAFVVDRIRRILKRLFNEVRSTISSLNAFTAERLGGMEVVQLYRDEERSMQIHDKLLEQYRVANIRTNLWDALLFAMMDGLSAVAMALLLAYATGNVGGMVTAGLLAAFIDYIARVFRPIQEFSAKIAILQRASTSLEKIFGLFLHNEIIPPGDVRLPTVSGHIVAKGLKFAYGDGPDVIQGIDFEIKPGQVVAFVGRTGSGKSSIARILTRTYAGYRGSITLDGIELNRIHPTDVRRGIGLVRQDVQLFPGDVRFNLTLGAKITDEALLDAIRIAQAEPLVAKLGGLDGKVAHQGANLSVGEAQLLSFARVMAHDPPVVLLDEATASVDTLTEARIQAATQAVFERKTAMVIAHRLSTVVDADCIVVLDHGTVVESGTHAQLLARDGAWAALFRQQFAELSEGAPETPAV